MDDQLALRSTVRALVMAFAEAERDVRAAFAMVVAAEERVNLVFLLGHDDRRIRITANQSGHGEDFAKPDPTVARMTKRAWELIVERLELKLWCSVARWKLVEKRLEDDKNPLPAITEQNVLAFIQEYMADAKVLVAEAVQEIYDWLRPRGPRQRGPGSPGHADRYAANRVVEIPAKVILSRVVGAADKWGWSPKVACSAELTALENIFHHLAGRGSVTKNYYSDIELAIRAAGASGEAETDLFRVRYFQNGNGHLWFKDADLLRKFNLLAGGKNLRPAPEEEETP